MKISKKVIESPHEYIGRDNKTNNVVKTSKIQKYNFVMKRIYLA